MLGLTLPSSPTALTAKGLIGLFQSILEFSTLLETSPSQATLSDETLAGRVSGDPQAFGELYRRYLQRIYAYHLVRTGNVAAAQDLTSQTFLAALEGISSFRYQGSFAAWLLGIARHKIADHYRHNPEMVELEAAVDTPSPQPKLEEVVERGLRLEQVSQALDNLLPERAEALALRIFGQLSATDTGKVMKKSAGAVRTLVYRALQDLRQHLGVSGIEMEDV